MALEYVTLVEAKNHCRVSHSFDDNLITVLVQAASGAVKNYLKDASVYEPERDDDDDPILDSNGYPEIEIDSNEQKTVRSEVKIAVLILVAEWYKNPAAGQDGGMGNGYLPEPVVALLYPLRDPTFE